MSKRAFKELLTPFLEHQLESLASRHGPDSEEYLALARQYIKTPDEQVVTEESNTRHYEADIGFAHEGRSIPGVERLYRRTLVIEPTLACAAHCRYCIRANYPRHNLSEDQLTEIARFCGHETNRDDLNEILVTGGDVLLVPQRVDFLLREIVRYAPNIRIARIATRIPLQDPDRVNENVLAMFRNKPSLRFELATQINHRAELFPEVTEAFRKIMSLGVRVYAQNVLLRGVNDRLQPLVDLYDALRAEAIESHYLFHCVPLQGMAHLRITLDESVALAQRLTSCGLVSGRAKPMVTAMTDIGKIVLYEGVIVGRDSKHVLLQSRYRMAERLRWNPHWPLPQTAEVDRDGYLRVWYLDGIERRIDRTIARSPVASRIDPVLRPLTVLQPTG